MKIKTILGLFFVCTSAMNIWSAEVLDQMQSIKSIHSLQAREEQVRAFRRCFDPEIQARKEQLKTDWDAIATLDLLSAAIRGQLILDSNKLNPLKDSALGTRGRSSFFNYGIREFLQSLFKAITMGIGYDKGVVNANLSDDKMKQYKSVVVSVNPYFDENSQKSEIGHIKATDMKDPEKQGHINEAHKLMIGQTAAAKAHDAIIFGSSDGREERNETRFYESKHYGYEFANYYEASIKVNLKIQHPITEKVLDLSGKTYKYSENLFQAVKMFILDGQQTSDTFFPTKTAGNLKVGVSIDLTNCRPRQIFEASRQVTVINGMQDYWDTIKNRIMFEAVKAKFSQHSELAALLLSTGESALVENAVNADMYWGRDDGGYTSSDQHYYKGDRSRGGNWLGKALVHVRHMLRTGQLPIAPIPGVAPSKISEVTRKMLGLPESRNDSGQEQKFITNQLARIQQTNVSNSTSSTATSLLNSSTASNSSGSTYIPFMSPEPAYGETNNNGTVGVNSNNGAVSYPTPAPSSYTSTTYGQTHNNGTAGSATYSSYGVSPSASSSSQVQYILPNKQMLTFNPPSHWNAYWQGLIGYLQINNYPKYSDGNYWIPLQQFNNDITLGYILFRLGITPSYNNSYAVFNSSDSRMNIPFSIN